MLPKVATHILHQTSRAAAAIQNQSGHTIRNVLQLQSSSGPSASSGSLGSWNGAGSSSWGSNGAGPGGAKFNAGSRFYNGYTGVGRAVTQVNAATSQDSTSGQSDDSDDFNTKRVSLHFGQRPRLRSHSLSMGAGRHERGEKLGVLKTVQMHIASRHAFASTSPLDSSALAEISSASSSHLVLVRRNSTSTSHTSDSLDSPPPPFLTQSPPPPLSSTDPAAPQSTSPPAPEEDRLVETATFRSLRAARDSKDPARALKTVLNFRSTTTNPTVMEFNMALEALHETRQQGDPLTIILETYNDMVKRSIYPNIRTYLILILALTDRDHEVQRVITSLEARNKRRELAGRIEAVQQATDEQRIIQLRAEKNLASAMALFDAAISLNGHRRIPLSVYLSLIKSCSLHCNIDGAIHVFAHLERRPDLLPTAAIFTHLIAVYTNAGDLQGAKEVFEEFKTAAISGRIGWTLSSAVNPAADTDEVANERHALARSAQLAVWNKMMEAHFRCNDASGALGLLEQMMDSKAVGLFTPSHPPSPASSTFSLIIGGFCQTGDVKTALAWFDQLLAQGDVARHPYEPTTVPCRPDQIAWMIMLEHLAHAGMIEDLNRIWSTLKTTALQEGLAIRAIDRVMVFNANMKYLEFNPELDDATALKIVDFLEQHVLQEGNAASPVRITGNGARNMIEKLAEQYVKLGAAHKALDVVERQVTAEMMDIRQAEKSGELTKDHVHWKMKQLRYLIMAVTPSLLQRQHSCGALILSSALRVARLSDSVGLLPHRPLAPYYLHTYGLAKAQGEKLSLSYRDWDLLAFSSTAMDLPVSEGDVREAPQLENYAFQGTASLVEDLCHFGIPLDKILPATIRRIVRALYVKLNADELQAFFAKLSPEYERLLNNPKRDLHALRVEDGRTKKVSGIIPSKDPKVKIDPAHSRVIDEHCSQIPKITPIVAYSRFEAGLRKNTYPTPASLGRLINALGRLAEVDKVRKLYETAQIVLSSLDDQKQWQTQGWFQVEDSMIIAYAHAGDIDAAHVHRIRIMEQGGSPSADAYGALIHSVKDTTDDTSNAMALFKESQQQGVTPSVYLYNTIISKLAKARKADFALELFQQMKANNFRPSSITFGAVIAACARVGDTYSAEMLFNEMTSQPNFRPRIPPYNTMMQLYTSTKPDRERALHYYEALLHARIHPSSHTYKLLIDAYGTIEPVNVSAMEEVFTRLQNDARVPIQGSHWASLIHVYGCVKKDLDKALEVFECIATHPSTASSSTPLPDAVTYESLINVLVTHRRTDLIPQYIHRLQASNIHMTAYIVNFMIKGYAAVGDLEQARALFEELEDPPQGVAAPNNHVPHEGAPTTQVPHSAPVYREPSTWEAMVRSELGNGNRDRALALLQRLQARQFPPAVYNRISGIMLDDSVSPWASDPSSPSSFDMRSYSS